MRQSPRHRQRLPWPILAIAFFAVAFIVVVVFDDAVVVVVAGIFGVVDAGCVSVPPFLAVVVVVVDAVALVEAVVVEVVVEAVVIEVVVEAAVVVSSPKTSVIFRTIIARRSASNFVK